MVDLNLACTRLANLMQPLFGERVYAVPAQHPHIPYPLIFPGQRQIAILLQSSVPAESHCESTLFCVDHARSATALSQDLFSYIASAAVIRPAEAYVGANMTVDNYL